MSSTTASITTDASTVTAPADQRVVRHARRVHREYCNDTPFPRCHRSSACRGVRHDPFQGASAHPTHRRVAVRVVPNGPHRLFECPCLATFPFEIVAGELIAQHLAWTGVEQVPGTHQVQRGLCWSQTTDV